MDQLLKVIGKYKQAEVETEGEAHVNVTRIQLHKRCSIASISNTPAVLCSLQSVLLGSLRLAKRTIRRKGQHGISHDRRAFDLSGKTMLLLDPHVNYLPPQQARLQ